MLFCCKNKTDILVKVNNQDIELYQRLMYARILEFTVLWRPIRTRFRMERAGYSQKLCNVL